HRVDEREVLRDPPFRDARSLMVAKLLGRHARLLVANDARQRPLAPALVGTADDRRLDDSRVRHQLALELYRRDPLAARLDDVLGAVGDLDEAALVDRSDVAGAQPPGVELVGAARVVVVVAGDPRPADLEL